jgi:hypothetical protein
MDHSAYDIDSPVAPLRFAAANAKIVGMSEDSEVHEDLLDYPRLMVNALRGVLREALAIVEEEGLPGEHHLYIAFRTQATGVVLPPYIRDQYPEQMTIVLQNQFSDLLVDEDGFSVTLSFSGARQRLYIPFAAVLSFADPAAQFGLQFVDPPTVQGDEQPESGEAEASEAAGTSEEETAEAEEKGSGKVVAFDPKRKR